MHESDARRPEPPRWSVPSRGDRPRHGARPGRSSIPAAGTATLDQRRRGCPPAKAAPRSRRSSPAVLRALVARLIPADANGPSGVDAGAAAYIEKALGRAR